MPEFVRGACEEMCPAKEVKLRTKEHLLHFFELKRGTKNDPDKVVKAFSRSAAGIKTPRKEDLRTVGALQRTIEYLLKEIVLDKRKPFNLVYDFIFDRLRSVRQEIVMQNFDSLTTIKLMEPIILFLAYSSYRLCSEKIDNFDPKICNQHLQECLKRVLCCYDDLDLNNKSTLNLRHQQNRSFIEALYQIFNLGSPEALQRSLILKKEIRDPIFNLAQKISLEYFRGNLYQAITRIKELPHLLCAVASLQIPILRKQMLLRFSHAFNSKTFVVPIAWIKDLLLYSTVDKVLEDCTFYNVEIVTDKNAVRFCKQNFDDAKTVLKPMHESFVDVKLNDIYLPEVLLLKKL